MNLTPPLGAGTQSSWGCLQGSPHQIKHRIGLRAGVNGGLRGGELKLRQWTGQAHVRLLDRGIESAAVLLSQAGITVFAQTFTEITQRADVLPGQEFAEHFWRWQEGSAHFICAT
jgi:hypothetical protein